MMAAVQILDGPGRFDPADVTIQRGGTVTWTHAGNEPHTVSDTGGAGLESMAINGRVFVGNTPIIVAHTGKRIRWYVFNLDLSPVWHNFHIHGQRWRVGEESIDTRSIGPAESFVADARRWDEEKMRQSRSRCHCPGNPRNRTARHSN